MKIGIFGGCFNPPHRMHKNIALELINNQYLDKVIYVPTGSKYNKKDLISIEHRINMLTLMIKQNNNLWLSDIGNSDNHQYTYQVLDYFQNENLNDDIYFICGTDNLNEFDTWKEYKYILENYKLLVIGRNNDNINIILKKYNNYKNNIIIARIEQDSLSSTMIRQYLINGDFASVKDDLDDNIIQYIKTKKYIKMIYN